MTGTYDPFLVALSYIVAAFGGYVALDLTSHARRARRWSNAWLAGASLALGAGIWSMHFIGMLALQTPMPITYDTGLTALSFALAVTMSGAGLFAVAQKGTNRLFLPVAGTLTGLGIVSMHYVGMASMQMPARLDYDTSLVILSTVIAVAASCAALWLAFHTHNPWQRMASALVMGLAVVSMHYTGMAAARFSDMDHGDAGMDMAMALSTPNLAVGTAAGTILLLTLALASALLDRQREARRAAAREAQYRSIFDTAVDPIVVVDEDGIIRSYNHAAEETFGHSAEEAINAPIALLIPDMQQFAPGDLARSGPEAERQAGGRFAARARDACGRRKDGSLFPLELSVSEWRDGRRRYFTGILRDVTARKAAEAALRQAKEEADIAREAALAARDLAERADMAKTKFLAAASHDLRQPLQSLFFFTHALSDKLGGHAASPLLASMSGSLDAMRALLDSLLDVSKLDAGVVTPNVSEFPLGPLLERLAGEYAGRAGETGIAFRHVPTKAWTRTDPALLERIVRNLIENAIRYTEAGTILIGCRRRRGALAISVVDTGIGIPDDRREDIFEEFTQLANPERDRRKGLGLGLAIVKRLSGLLGHGIEVRSEPGRGSVFAVTVPVVETRPAPVATETATLTRLPGKGLVVVVEDDAIILLSMRAMLEEWGYKVVSAMSSEEAIESILGLGQQPDMIVADYRLREGRTGVQAIRDIYGVCGVRIPALVLTGDTDPARIAEVKQSGFLLLHKPVSPGLLREALASAA